MTRLKYIQNFIWSLIFTLLQKRFHEKYLAKSPNAQRRVLNRDKHLRWSFFAKTLNPRCLTGFWIHLWWRLGQKTVRQENLKDPDKMFSAKKYSKGKKAFLGRHGNVGIRSWIDKLWCNFSEEKNWKFELFILYILYRNIRWFLLYWFHFCSFGVLGVISWV